MHLMSWRFPRNHRFAAVTSGVLSNTTPVTSGVLSTPLNQGKDGSNNLTPCVQTGYHIAFETQMYTVQSTACRKRPRCPSTT